MVSLSNKATSCYKRLAAFRGVFRITAWLNVGRHVQNYGSDLARLGNSTLSIAPRGVTGEAVSVP